MRESEKQYSPQDRQGAENFSRAQAYLSLKGEGLQTRTEHSRSLEDAEKYRALETLKSLGVLIPLSELEIYHGRAAHPGETEAWEVDPAFSNGGNNTGNSNVNKRSTLYTGHREIATDFARARSGRTRDGSISQPEIHRIDTHDLDATVFNHNFDISKLSPQQISEYTQALSKILVSPTEGSPLDFQDRAAWGQLIPHIASLGERRFFSDDDTDRLVTQSGLSTEVVTQLIGAINSRQMAKVNPGYLISRLVNGSEDLSHGYMVLDGERIDMPLNLEYVQKYLHEAHIVGVQQPVYSATLDQDIEIVSFFDLDEVKTSRSKERERERSWTAFGGLAQAMDGLVSPEAQSDSPLMAQLTDTHAKPRDIMQDAQRVPGYEQIFAGSAGVWEGFTLGEHTETVLRNFDETYADRMPVGLLAPMRLAILTHDIGKSETVARLSKLEQSKINTRQAIDFMDKLGVDERHQDVIISMVGLGADLAYLIDVKGEGGKVKQAMFQLAQGTMREFFGREPSRDEMRAFVEMCRTLQRCDGGAYTSMAVTRSRDGNGYYRNAPSFNASFAQPVDAGRRKVGLRKPGQQSAQLSQAPKSMEPVSRIRMQPRGVAAKPPKLQFLLILMCKSLAFAYYKRQHRT